LPESIYDVFPVLVNINNESQEQEHPYIPALQRRVFSDNMDKLSRLQFSQVTAALVVDELDLKVDVIGFII